MLKKVAAAFLIACSVGSAAFAQDSKAALNDLTNRSGAVRQSAVYTLGSSKAKAYASSVERLAYDSDPRALIGLALFLLFGEVFNELIEQLAEALLIARGNSDRIAESQVIEFVNISLKLLEIIDFVNSQDNGLLRTAQHVRNLEVRVDKTLTHIDKEHDNIGRIDRDLGLFSHRLQDRIRRIGLDSARIYDRK